jgi:hypothetical protein
LHPPSQGCNPQSRPPIDRSMRDRNARLTVCCPLRDEHPPGSSRPSSAGGVPVAPVKTLVTPRAGRRSGSPARGSTARRKMPAYQQLIKHCAHGAGLRMAGILLTARAARPDSFPEPDLGQGGVAHGSDSGRDCRDAERPAGEVIRPTPTVAVVRARRNEARLPRAPRVEGPRQDDRAALITATPPAHPHMSRLCAWAVLASMPRLSEADQSSAVVGRPMHRGSSSSGCFLARRVAVAS